MVDVHAAAGMLFNVLLRRGVVQLAFSAEATGVVCPSSLQGNTMLEYGLNLPVPIKDILADEFGVGATLSFRGSPMWTHIPWSAVYAIVGEGGGLVVNSAETLETLDVPAPSKPGLKLVT